MKKVTSDFTKLIKKIRIENEITLAQLAKVTGKSANYLCQAENENIDYDLDVIQKILEYLTVTDEEKSFIFNHLLIKKRNELEVFEKQLYNAVYGK